MNSPAPMVQCDLCEAPMPLPERSRFTGAILGLLVCTQCIEDELNARAFNANAEVGMVGASR